METPIDLSDFNLNVGNIIDLNVEGKIFKYKVPTNEDEFTWATESMEDHGVKKLEGKEVRDLRLNVGKLNYIKLRNIVSVPYNKEQIMAVFQEKNIQVDCGFEGLTAENKKLFLSLLDQTISNKLITEINKVGKDLEEVKKN